MYCPNRLKKREVNATHKIAPSMAHLHTLQTFCDMQHTKKTFETKSKDEMIKQTKNQTFTLGPTQDLKHAQSKQNSLKLFTNSTMSPIPLSSAPYHSPCELKIIIVIYKVNCVPTPHP